MMRSFFFQNRLSLRLVVASLIISSVLSVFATGLQLYFSYASQKRDAVAGLQLVEETLADPLSRGLWEFNLEIVQAILEGVVASDFIKAVALDAPTGHAWHLGEPEPGQYQEIFPLIYTEPQGTAHQVGVLRFSLDFSTINQRIWSQLWTTLASNIAKAYLGALGLLLLFHLMIARHLRKIAHHIDTAAAAPAHHNLHLQRRSPEKPDELDKITGAFNDYEARILHHLAALETEVHERKQAENAAREALSIRTAFLTTVSHEIRTPLNAILGILHLIEIMQENPPKTRQHARTALAAGQNLLEMLTNTLEAARLEAKAVEIRPVRTDMRTLANHWLETTRAAVHRRGKGDCVNVTLHLHSNLAEHYLLDGARLSQVVGNLTDNAAKFTSHGEIAISIKQRGENTSDQPVSIAVSVRDTGIGIPQNTRKMIFERFSQVDHGLKRQHDGSGLGLAISSEIAELMGGSLDLLEHPTNGFATEFVFLIPTETIAEQADEQPTKSPAC